MPCALIQFSKNFLFTELKLELPMLFFNARDIQKQSFTDVEAAIRRCFPKYVFLKFGNIRSKTPALESHFNKETPIHFLYQKETPTTLQNF